MSNLTVLTWNVWFNSFAASSRYHHILSLVNTIRPDVVCYQEVTSDFLSVLRTQDWISQYECSDNLHGNTFGRYGAITLCKASLRPVFKIHPLPSDMERKLVACHLHTESAAVVVGNVHLESLHRARTREIQLKSCAALLSPHPLTILLGDFNFCSYRNFRYGGPLENDMLQRQMPDYIDVWHLLHPNERGYTFDTVKNRMLADRDRRIEQMRYDRVNYRSTSRLGMGTMEPVSIELLGTSRLLDVEEGSQEAVFPSDHFALLTRFRVN